MVFGVAGDLVVTTFHGHQECLLSRALPSGTVTVFSLLWFRGCHHGICLIDRGVEARTFSSFYESIGHLEATSIAYSCNCQLPCIGEKGLDVGKRVGPPELSAA